MTRLTLEALAPAAQRRASHGRRQSDLEGVDATYLLEAFEEILVVVADDDFTVLRAHPTHLTPLGHEARQVIGRPVADLLPERERHRLGALLHAWLRRPPPVEIERFTAVMLAADGSEVEMTGRVRRLHLLTHDRSAFAIALRPMTDLDRARQRVAAERARADLLLNSLHDGVLECDLTARRHLYANARFAQMVGRTVDEVLDAPWPGPWWEAADAADMETFAERVAHHGVIGGEPCTGHDLTLVGADGTRVPVRMHVSFVETAERVTVVANLHDRTGDLRRAAELDHAHGRLAIATERERIARDLHDSVIQRLFATGMNLQSALSSGDTAEHLLRSVEAIDETIHDIRATIFTLHTPRALLEGLEAALRNTVAEAARLLDHDPALTLAGDLERLDTDLAIELLAITRELLSNAAKHAEATSTWVHLRVGDTVELEVGDDGVGYRPTPGQAGNGMRNLVERAAGRNGSVSIVSAEPQGTVVRWRVPLTDGPLP